MVLCCLIFRLEQWFDDAYNDINLESLEEILNTVCNNVLEIKDIILTLRRFNT